ncbi:MAG TPA: asparagine synthase (glutamine-hydrolyzing) [Patescibacteria group bacterium]|nr:asparagine synthase (glutamine-hydrolyzing) [Patescibacteria group bacterium]
MCGIAGYIGKKNIGDDAITKTLSAMSRRGPDAQEHILFKNGENYVNLLHSRLSIIDLDERANQPFTIGNCTLVFNGEIYNYLELRELLKKQGETFFTESDTEVLLKYYLYYGEKCVEYFEGMWAFAIWDARANSLFLSRDRFAEKPLYFFKTEDGFYFGSEVKFLKSLSGEQLAVNHTQILRYLINGYKSLYKTSETFFKNVHEIPYATNAIVNSDGEISFKKYWEPVYHRREMSLDEAIEGTRAYLINSVKLRLRSDVPMAFCLSGGVDSSALVSIAAKEFGYKVSTFSIIDSDERYNEFDNIQATVEDIGCDSHLLEIPQSEALDRLKRLVQYHDAPIATTTYYVHSLLSEAISKAGFKVVFSGTSADELFTGYYDHFIWHLAEMSTRADYDMFLKNWQTHILPFVRNPYLQQPELYVKNPALREHIYFQNDEFREFLKEDFQEEFHEEIFTESLLRNRMMNELFHEATPVILHEDDLNSMMHSLENRSPFLDSRLFDFAYSIPNEHLIHNGYGKYILRESVKGILNEKVRTDRRKKGFNASINSVIDLRNPDVVDYLLDENAEIFTILDREKIREAFTMSPMPNSFSKFLFSFINVRIFLEQN